MDTISTEQMSERIRQLPSLPEICNTLEDLLDDPTSTPSDVAAELEVDMVLTSRVLRLANSPYCAISGGVDNLHQAVTFLGFSTIHQIVLCAQSHAFLRECGAEIPAWLLAHGRAVAVVAEGLAVQYELPFPPKVQAAGLLHDLGRLGLAALYPDSLECYVQVLRRGAQHSLDLEREVIGVDHQTAGQTLVELWRFPPMLSQVISAHHDSSASVTSGSMPYGQETLDLIAIADWYAWDLGHPGLPVSQPPQLDPLRLERMGLAISLEGHERARILTEIDAQKDV